MHFPTSWHALDFIIYLEQYSAFVFIFVLVRKNIYSIYKLYILRIFTQLYKIDD